MKEIKTEKFTENTMSVRWFFDLDRKTMTAWNLLSLMLSARTEDFPSRQAFHQACSHAYGVRCGYGMYGYGQKFLLEYRMTWIRPDLVDSASYPQEIVHLMDQSLHHPLLNQAALNEARYLLKNRLSALSQDPEMRAMREALQAAGGKTSLGVSMQGYLEDLDSVSLKDLQALYDQLKETPSQTILLGRTGSEVRSFMEKRVPGQLVTTRWKAAAVHEPRHIVLERKLSQSSLVQVYATGILPQDPQYFALLMLNALLGSSSVSLLFEIIREQHSYCYSISSSLIRFDGVLMITTGARREHLDDVKRLIAEIMEDICQERFSLETFKMVRDEMCDTLRGQIDSPAGLIEQEFLNEILDRPITLEEMIARLEAVSPQDVAQAARQLVLISSAELLEKEAGEDMEEELEEKTEEEE